MELPDDILRHIKEFAKPKLKTRNDWFDFYLKKATLLYKVGMQFDILGVIHTIISITKKTIITQGGDIIKHHILHKLSYFRYGNLEIHGTLRWDTMVNSPYSLKKRQFISNVLLYIDSLLSVKHPYNYFTQGRNKYLYIVLNDYNNYKDWGAVVTGP